MKLEHDTWVLVADGQKYLLLRNAGDRDILDLRVVDHETDQNPPARALSSDRAGRRYDSARAVRGGVEAWGKSAMEQTDWHRVAEERFAEDLAAQLGDWVSEGRFRHLLLVADPRTLGALRSRYGDSVRSTIVAEMAKDLTNLPIEGIETAVAGFDA